MDKIVEVGVGAQGAEALVRWESDQGGSYPDEWLLLEDLSTDLRRVARSMLKAAGLCTGGQSKGVSERARRAMEERRAAAAGAAAVQQRESREARARAREAAMQARQPDGGGGGERRVEVASCKRRGEEAQSEGGGERRTQRRADEGASSSGTARGGAGKRSGGARAGKVGGRKAKGGTDGRSVEGVRSRPEQLDVVLGENAEAYASYTDVGGAWLGGLFAKRDLVPGETIAKYEGAILTNEEADASKSEYLMTAVDVRDNKRRVVIDGHPKHGNLAGYANYAAHKVANAVFEDQGKIVRSRDAGGSTDVVLQAWAHIAAGQEIRVDYDMGVTGRPFRQQMIRRGVAASELDGPGYGAVRWAYPGEGASGAPDAGGRKRVGEEAEVVSPRGEEERKREPRGAGGRNAEGSAKAEGAGAARAEEGGRKRGSRAAKVASPRGAAERKRVPRSESQRGQGK